MTTKRHRITLRILELFDALREARILDGNQIADLLYGGPSSLCRDHLYYFTDPDNKFDTKHIGRIEQPSLRSEGSKPYLYYLRKKGAEELAQHKGIFIEDLEWEGKKPPVSPHLLFGSEVYTRFAIACKKYTFTMKWLNGLVMRQGMTDEFDYETPNGYIQKGMIIPDGFCQITTPNGNQFDFFREDDRGLETNATVIADKTMKYRTYFYTPKKGEIPSLFAQRYGTEDGRVLFAVPTHERLIHMKRTVENCGGKGKYLFVVLSELKTHNPFFDAIWYKGGTDTPVPLMGEEKIS